MKHAIILIIGILATSVFADQDKHNINKIYGNGIAFSDHLLITTGYVARHTEKLDSIVVMVNNKPIIARVEHSMDTVFNKSKNEYFSMAIIQVDNRVVLNACQVEDRVLKDGDPVIVTGISEDDPKIAAKSFPAKVVADSTFPEYVASALNIKLPNGFSGSAISSHGKVIGMTFGNSTRKENISFFYDGILLNEYLKKQNRPTTTDISKCVYQVRSYVPVE